MNARSCEKQIEKEIERIVMGEILISTGETEAQRAWLSG